MREIATLLGSSSPKRSLVQVTVFDFIILLIIFEATSAALVGDDSSITGAMLVVLTLITLNRAFDQLTYRSGRLDRLLNDVPVVLVANGEPLAEPMRRNRIDANDHS